jgi:acyl-CoA reductase-like NAD-dependent aldehyde dehydrogenase
MTAETEPERKIRPLWPHFVGGRVLGAATGQTFPVHNPANGRQLCEVARGGPADVDDAVRAARAALPAWAAIPVANRRRILNLVASQLAAHTDELAIIECLSCGKPLREAREDVEKTADAFAFYAGFADKLFGTSIPTTADTFNYTTREPVGVTAHIAPWNYPLRLAMRSVAPALAAGNTVVLKPAEQAPLTALHIGRLLAEAGIPPGVYNVVTGYGSEAGAALAGHPGINHLSFTGSSEVGIEVMRRAAENVVPVTLELGGKSPNIVFADADLDAAIEGVIKGIFTNAGQVCCAGSRLLLEESVYDDFLTRLVRRTKEIRVGPGIGNPDMGPLISQKQHQAVLSYIDVARKEGAEVVLGGAIPKAPACQEGYFVEPTLLHGVANTTRIAREEVFGPVLTILPFRGDDEAMRLANESPYGLVAGMWTSDVSRAHLLARQLDAGQIYVNDFFSGSTAIPFGGNKRSGFGRERGLEAFQHYTQVKSVSIRLKKRS